MLLHGGIESPADPEMLRISVIARLTHQLLGSLPRDCSILLKVHPRVSGLAPHLQAPHLSCVSTDGSICAMVAVLLSKTRPLRKQLQCL